MSTITPGGSGIEPPRRRIRTAERPERSDDAREELHAFFLSLMQLMGRAVELPALWTGLGPYGDYPDLLRAAWAPMPDRFEALLRAMRDEDQEKRAEVLDALAAHGLTGPELHLKLSIYEDANEAFLNAAERAERIYQRAPIVSIRLPTVEIVIAKPRPTAKAWDKAKSLVGRGAAQVTGKALGIALEVADVTLDSVGAALAIAHPAAAAGAAGVGEVKRIIEGLTRRKLGKRPPADKPSNERTS